VSGIGIVYSKTVNIEPDAPYRRDLTVTYFGNGFALISYSSDACKTMIHMTASEMDALLTALATVPAERMTGAEP
jgi:hypothetical protein